MESFKFINLNKAKILFKENVKLENTEKFKFFKYNVNFKSKIFCIALFSILYLIYLFKFKYTRIFPNLSLAKVYESNKINSAEKIIKESFEIQKDFCNNPNKYFNKQYENMIKLTDFRFKNIFYQLFVYKKGDNHMSNFIMRTKGYDINEMTNFYDILEHYRKEKNILNKKDVYMLDLGGNLGVYPSYFGRLGYTVISFEASPRNYYLLKKNYCQINRNAENIIIINRGVSNYEGICNYYTQITGLGNGMLKCDENRESFDNAGFHWIKTFEVPIIKLSNFIPYFSKKNLALIKLDIEGSEALVMKDAIDLIKKYHIPYIYSEFSTNMINEHGNNPREYIKLFTDNGYKVNKKGFLSKKFIPPDKVSPGNLYFTYFGK